MNSSEQPPAPVADEDDLNYVEPDVEASDVALPNPYTVSDFDGVQDDEGTEQ